MTEDERQQLATLIRSARLDHGWSARELSRRAGVDVATVSLLERGAYRQPTADTIRSISQALGLPLTDVYTAIHWLPSNELSSLRPYMRSKFSQLPDDAVADVERYIARLTQRYGTGPADGQDEEDEEI